MKEIEQLEVLVGEIDHLYQEGVIFNSADIKTIEIYAQVLKDIVYDLNFQKAWKEARA